MIDSVTRRRDSISAKRTAAATSGQSRNNLPAQAIVTPSEIPEFFPPVRQGTVRVDADGNLWIPPSTSRLAGSGLAYNVVNSKGVIVERVVLPAGRTILAFGDGVAYLAHREGNAVHLEKASLR